MDYRNKFINAANIKFDNYYDYSNINYINSYTPIELECPNHGSFKVIPKNHIQRRQGCPICDSNKSRYATKRTAEFDEFVKRSILQHGERYIYLPENFTKMRERMSIICPTHGEFSQEAKYHVKAKVGCKHCYFDLRIDMRKNGGYTLEYFKMYPDEKVKSSQLYTVMIEFENGDKCIKLGITTKSVKQRFHTNRKDKIKRVLNLNEIRLPLFDAFIYEQQLISELYPFKFRAKHKFDGYTECFKINPQVIQTLQDYFGINIADKLESE